MEKEEEFMENFPHFLFRITAMTATVGGGAIPAMGKPYRRDAGDAYESTL